MKRFLIPLLLLAAVPCWAGTRDLKEDTAVTIVVGPFVDDTGAAVTAPTIASIDITAYKNDGTAVGITPAASGSSNDMVHVDDGYYSLEVTTTDTSTPGYLRLTFQISGSLIFHEDFNILPANIYDSKYSTDKLDVNVVEAAGTAWGSGAITAGSIATDAIDADAIAASAMAAGTEITGLLAAADIQTECEDALELYRLDELLAADSDIDGAAPPTVGSVFHEALTKTTGSFTYDQTTDSLEAIRDFDATIKSDTADAKTASEAAQAVIEDATNGNAAIKALLTTVAGYFTTNRAEPAQGAPAASTTFLAKLDYLYKFARNKKDASSSEVKYYNDDATTVDHKASVNTSGGTTTVGETATGP